MTRKPITWALVLVAAASMALSGCGDDDDDMTGTGGTGGTGGIGTIAITVGSGVNPTYTWPGVGVFSVSVVRTADPVTIVWGVVTPAQGDNITSPVTHGTVPAGALETAPTEATLTAGVEYRVTVSRQVGPEFGFTDFTP